ncbi:MAG: LCP family protein [Acidimicrobiales bacterium]
MSALSAGGSSTADEGPGQTPSRATDGSRRRSGRRRRPRRTWGQRLLIGFNIVVVLVCLVGAAGLTYVKRQVSDIERIQLGQGIIQQSKPSEPANFLLVGTDDDTGLDPNDPVLVGRDASLNTDTIMVLRVDPSAKKAWMLSFPRDLWVPIGGPNGPKGRINTALSSGGPQRLIETIQNNFGIPINHYVQVNFNGFKQLVNAIGGVPIYFPWPSRDQNTGLFQYTPGCQVLDADQALAFARSRHFETQDDRGVWTEDSSSDFGRVRRQQEFIRAALKKAIAQGARNPFTLNQLIEVGQKNVLLDSGITGKELVDLGRQLQDFDPDTLDVYTPPAREGWAGAAAVLYLNEGEAQPIFDIFRGNNPMVNVLKTIRVEVRNGTGKSGFARQVGDQLNTTGFTVTEWRDDTSFRNAKTTIRYANPNQKLAAVVLARYLDVDAVIEEGPMNKGDSTVALVLGSDFTGLRQTPRPLEDFKQYLPNNGADLPPTPADDAVSTTIPLSVTTSSVPAQIPTPPPGVDCR